MEKQESQRCDNTQRKATAATEFSKTGLLRQLDLLMFLTKLRLQVFDLCMKLI